MKIIIVAGALLLAAGSYSSALTPEEQRAMERDQRADEMILPLAERPTEALCQKRP